MTTLRFTAGLGLAVCLGLVPLCAAAEPARPDAPMTGRDIAPGTIPRDRPLPEPPPTLVPPARPAPPTTAVPGAPPAGHMGTEQGAPGTVDR